MSVKRPRSRFTLSREFSNDLIATMGEFVGTFLFLFIGEGAAKTAALTHYQPPVTSDQRKLSLSSESIMFVSLSFGLSLIVTCWMFFRISGSLFNPAITFALFLIGNMTLRRTLMLFVTQLVAGIAAAGMVDVLTPGRSPSGVVKLEQGVSITQGLFLEAVLTGTLVFSVLMMAAEKHRSTHLAPIGIGLTLFVCHLFGVLWTGASLNPARALGPSVIERTFPPYHWLYWLGPMMGSLLAVAFYLAMKSFDYTQVVLGQDADQPGDIPLNAIPTRLLRSLSQSHRRQGLDTRMGVNIILTDKNVNATTTDSDCEKAPSTLLSVGQNSNNKHWSCWSLPRAGSSTSNGSSSGSNNNNNNNGSSATNILTTRKKTDSVCLSVHGSDVEVEKVSLHTVTASSGWKKSTSSSSSSSSSHNGSRRTPSPGLPQRPSAKDLNQLGIQGIEEYMSRSHHVSQNNQDTNPPTEINVIHVPASLSMVSVISIPQHDSTEQPSFAVKPIPKPIRTCSDTLENTPSSPSSLNHSPSNKSFNIARKPLSNYSISTTAPASSSSLPPPSPTATTTTHHHHSDEPDEQVEELSDYHDCKASSQHHHPTSSKTSTIRRVSSSSPIFQQEDQEEIIVQTGIALGSPRLYSTPLS